MRIAATQYAYQGRGRPKIRILHDEDGPEWCGLYYGGYTSLGLVRRATLAQAIAFYFRLLRDGSVL